MSPRKKSLKPNSPKVNILNEQLRRKRETRTLERRFLIVCEDTKSSKDYFEQLKKHFGISAASVIVEDSGGRTQPTQVVQTAIDRQKAARQRPDNPTLPFDEVWCVIDGDSGPAIANARMKAEANGIHLAITTKCFEYWLILHYEDNDKGAHNCDGHFSQLKRHLPKYHKGKFDFSDVVGRVEQASQRAKRLRKTGLDLGELPEDDNPCSELYRLIEALLAAG